MPKERTRPIVLSEDLLPRARREQMHSLSGANPGFNKRWGLLIGAVIVGALTITLIKGYQYKQEKGAAKSVIVRQELGPDEKGNVPDNLPLANNSKAVLSSYTMTLPTGESQGIKKWVVLQSADSVAASYNSYLTTNGWTITLTATAGDTKVIGAYLGNNNIRISISPIPGNTSQSIIEVAASGGSN